MAVKEQDSVGDLVQRVADDLTTLVRSELQLLKTEVTGSVGRAGKGAGLLGAAGYAATMLLLFASLTAAFALDTAMPTWAAFGIVALVFAVLAGALALAGKAQLKAVDPTPHQAIDAIRKPVS